MWKSLLALGMIAAAASPLFGQSWSAGVAAGPVVFGRFAERRVPIGTESGTAVSRSRLSAATRLGGAVDLERALTDRVAVRAEISWTRAPLRIKSSGGEGVNLDAGTVNLTTAVIPRQEAKLHRAARIGRRSDVLAVRRDTGPVGGAAGVGVAWRWTRRFGIEWQVQDIITASPFRPDDIAPSPKGTHIPKLQNGHTTIGIRYRF